MLQCLSASQIFITLCSWYDHEGRALLFYWQGTQWQKDEGRKCHVMKYSDFKCGFAWFELCPAMLRTSAAQTRELGFIWPKVVTFQPEERCTEGCTERVSDKGGCQPVADDVQGINSTVPNNLDSSFLSERLEFL